MTEQFNNKLAFAETSAEKQSRIADKGEFKRQTLAEASRTKTELVTDARIAIAKGLTSLTQWGVGVLDASGLTEDDDTGLETVPYGKAYSALDSVKDGLEDLRSDKAKARNEQMEFNVQSQFDKSIAPQSQRLREQGWNESIISIAEQGEKYRLYLEEGIKNPSAIFDMALESAPEFLLGGALGKSLAQIPMRGMSKEQAASFMASEGGKKAVRKMATAAGVGVTVFSEGVSNGLEARDAVMSKKVSELVAESDDYIELIEQGYTGQQAREKLADIIFNQTFIQSGGAAALISKFTGAGRKQGESLNQKPDLDSKLDGAREIASSAGTEGLEEGLQGAVGTAITNNQIQRVDQDVKVTDNIGQAAAYGTLAGAAVGGSVDAGGKAVRKTVERYLNTKETVNEKVAKMGESVRKFREFREEIAKSVSEELKPITDWINKSNSEDFVETVVAAGDVAEANPEIDQTEVLNSMRERINQEYDAIEADGRKMQSIENPQEQAAFRAQLLERFERVNQANDYVADYRRRLNENEVLGENEFEAILAAPTQENAERVLGSIRIEPNSLSAEQAQTLIDTGVLDDSQVSELQAHIRISEASQELVNGSKNAQQVNYDIMRGTQNFKGILNFQTAVDMAIVSNDFKGAEKELASLVKFQEERSARAREIQAAYLPLTQLSNGGQLSQEQLDAIQKVEADYGLKLHVNSNKSGLIDSIMAESEALNATREMLEIRINKAKNSINADIQVPDAEVEESPVQAVEQESPAEASDPVPTPSQAEVEVNEADDTQEVETPLESTKEEELATNPDPISEPTDAEVQAQPEPNANPVGESETTTETTPKRTPEEIVQDYPADLVPNLEVAGEVISGGIIKGRITVAENIDPNQFLEQFLGTDGGKLHAHKQLVVQALRREGYSRKAITKFLDNPEVIRAFVTVQQHARVDAGLPQHYANIRQTKLNPLLTPSTIKKEAQAVVKAFEVIGLPKIKYNLGAKLTAAASDFSSKANMHPFVNVVQQYFNSAQGRRFTNTQENVLDLLDDELDAVKDYLEVETLTEAQIQAVTRFKTMAEKVLESFEDTVFKDESDYRKRKYINYLSDADGKIDKNIQAAIAVSIYNWIATDAQGTLLKSKEEINRMLGHDSDTLLEAGYYKLLAEKGDILNESVDKLGNDILSIVGIAAKKDAPQNLQTNLAQSLGAHAVAVMADMNLITVDTINQEDYLEAKSGEAAAASKFHTVKFIKARTNNQGELNEKLLKIQELNKESNYVIGKLFNAENIERGPSYSTPRKPSKKVKGTDKIILPEVLSIIKKEHKRPWEMKVNNLTVFDALTYEQQLKMFGYLEDYEEKTHVDRLISVKAVNAEIVRSLTNLKNHRELLDIAALEELPKGVEKKGQFFYNYRMAKQGRVMMDSNTFNMQADKIHRHFAKAADWEAEYDLENPEDMRSFMLAVADGFDISTDKKTGERSLADLNERLLEGPIQKAVASIINQESMDTAEFQQNILEGVKAVRDDEPAYALDTLVALAQMEKAKLEGKTTFVSDLAREIDGLTNGPAIGILQLMAGSSIEEIKVKLSRMGIFFDGTQTVGEHVSQESVEDSYESLASIWKSLLIEKEKDLKPKELKELAALTSLFGEIDRKRAKSPLIQTSYGSGEKAINIKLSADIIENIYEKLEEFHKRDDSTEAKRAELDKDFNKLQSEIETLTGQPLAINSTSFLELKLTKRQIGLLEEKTSNILGAPLHDAIGVEYGQFKKNIHIINATYSSIFTFYEKVFNEKVADKKRELINNGELLSDSMDLSKEDLDAIKQELIAIEPILDTYYSAKAGKLGYGIETIKTSRSQEVQQSAYAVENTFNNKIKNLNAKNMKSWGRVKKMEDPGVGSGVMGIHSIDAATMMQTLYSVGALNIYDAIMVSAKDAQRKGRVINESFLNINKNFSLMDGVVKAYNRAFEQAQILDSKNNKGYVNTLRSSLELGDYVGTSPREQRIGLLANKERIDSTKSKIFADMTMMNQYVLEGSEIYLKPENLDRDINLMDAVEESGERTLNSSGTSFDPTRMVADEKRRVSSANSEDVFDYLGKGERAVQENGEHKSYLRKLLTGSVNKVVEPFNLHLKRTGKTETVGATSGLDMWILRQIDNADPVVSRMLANGIRMSAQETYLHELVHNITKVGVDKRNSTTRQLEKLWEAAQRKIEIKDFMDDPDMSESDPQYSREYEAARVRYEHIFEPKSGYRKRTVDKSTGLAHVTEQADYLHEFVAFGMTNQRFRKLLSDIEPSEYQQKVFRNIFKEPGKVFTNLFEMLRDLFDAIAASVRARSIKYRDKQGDQQIDALFKQLARIERESKNKVLQKLEEKTEQVLGKGNELAQRIREQVGRIGQAPLIAKNRLAVVRAAGQLTSALSSRKPEFFMDAVEGYFSYIKQGKAGISRDIITEVKGRTADNGKFYNKLRAANVAIDHQRKNMKSSLVSELKKSFARELDKDERTAVLKGLLKTDLVSLWDTYGTEGLQSIIQQDVYLENEIQKLENSLMKYKLANHYINQSKGLGWYMATGRVAYENQALNAKRIAAGIATGINVSPQHVSNVENTIDLLASLYAVKYTDKKSMKILSKLFQEEISRSDEGGNALENGITFTLWQHRDLKKQAESRIFKGDEANMVKGYVKEIFNPHIDVKYAGLDQEDKLREHGYIRMAQPIVEDIDDVTNKSATYMYVSKHGGLSPFEAGIISRTNRKAKGTNLTDLINQQFSKLLTKQRKKLTKQALTTIRGTKRLKTKAGVNLTYFDPTKIKDNKMVPVFDMNNNITDYRYLMQEKTKDNVLEKNNDFFEVLGAMGSNIVDKTHTDRVNRETIELLKEQYLYEIKDRFNQYVKISLDSPDPEFRELYAALPDQAKRDIKEIWGTDGMLVRNDLVSLVFGQRKLSMADRWDMDPADRQLFDRIFISVAEMFLRKNVPAKLRSVENVWKEIVKDLKEIIVIKTFAVTFMNTLSNAMLLKLMGVPIKEIIKQQAIGFEGIQSYKKDRGELMALRRELRFKANTASAQELKKIEQAIARISNNLANNPVRELVEAGVYQTIVEDLGEESDPYSYKSKFAERVDEYLGVADRLPEGVKNTLKEVFVVQGSTLYTTANEFAQMSDFVARFALHQHFLKRKVKPLSKEKSIETIMEIFINYEIPTNEYIQYGNDIGVVWFSKYAMRVLKVLFRTFRERPATVLALIFLQQQLGDVPDIHDTNLNPFDRVRMPDFDVFGQIGPVDLIGDVF